MVNGDLSNALQSILQIFLEIDDLAIYFNKPTPESSDPLHIAMKRVFTLTYRETTDENRKPINLKKFKNILKK